MRLVNVVMSVLALSGLAHVSSQDLLTVAPGAAKVEYEDAAVRVVRLRIPPGASLPMHDRPARVVIPLTANDVRITRADGTVNPMLVPAGRVAWSEPARRAVTNLGSSTLENIIVEVKTAREPATAAAQPPAPVPPDYLDEPLHHWLLENQYVRVYEARIAPGGTTGLHRHAYDSVAVFVSGGFAAMQVEGQAWGRTEKFEPGSVAFGADSKTPYAHRVRNDGTTEFRVILVQLFQTR